MDRPGDYLIEAIADAVAERLTRTSRNKRLLDLDETCNLLGLSEDAIRDLVAQGKLVPVRPTRKLQFDINDLDDYIRDLKKKKGDK